MSGTADSTHAPCDQFLAEITDAALEVTARHGVKGPSVVREISLWRALGSVLRRKGPPDCRAAAAPADEPGRDELVAELTDTAYRLVLAKGFRGSFLDLQLDLWKAVCRVYPAIAASHFSSRRVSQAR